MTLCSNFSVKTLPYSDSSLVRGENIKLLRAASVVRWDISEKEGDNEKNKNKENA